MTRRSPSQTQTKLFFTPVQAGLLQRKCASCGQHAIAGGECAECNKEKQVMQRRASSQSEVVETPAIVQDVLRSPGQPLDGGTRSFMESRFGHDFSQVRVHTDAQAAESAQQVNATAYTVGHTIAFGAGQYRPNTISGQRLLAHELTHVVQQQHLPGACSTQPLYSQSDHPAEQEADRIAATITSNQAVSVSQTASGLVSRTPLNISEIKQDIDDGINTPRELFSWLHVMGERSGEVGFAAGAPPVGSGFSQAPVPEDTNLPIAGIFFPSMMRHHDRRALVLGGFHGNEKPGIEIADALVTELRTSTSSLASGLNFHTLVIPYVNPWGIAHNNRCNRQSVDLNRNLPVPGATTSANQCVNNVVAPVQPETQAVVNVIRQFQPHRILSMHSIGTVAEAGVFADPASDPTARQLACSMAGQIVDPTNRRGNLRSGTPCNPVYPGGATGGRSLGAYAPTRSIPNQSIPVITLEVPGHQSLSGSRRPPVSEFMPAVREFLQ